MLNMGMLKDYIQEQAAAKKKTPEAWLRQQTDNARKCTCATHVGRFTHPSVGVTYHSDVGTDTGGGYVATATVCCPEDVAIAGGAACMPAVKLLQYPVEDGRSVLAHLQNEPDFLQRELAGWSLDFADISAALLSVEERHAPTATDTRLRQVYFPVGEDYHLLTVLPPSSVALELRQRVRTWESAGRQARDSKDETYGNSYQQLFHLTEISFGGTKPQNISYLNLQRGGRLSVLASVPPALQLRRVHTPHWDFFRENLQLRQFKDDCQRLSKLYRASLNNDAMRKLVRHREQLLLDKIMLAVYQLRSSLEPGWSRDEHSHLPQAQKIWLDEAYVDARWQDETWQAEIAAACARWLMQTREFFEAKGKQEKILLGNAEFVALQKQAMLVIREQGEAVQKP